MRSALYVAAHRADHLAKSWAVGADAVVVELEDGVPMAAKEDARSAMTAALAGQTPCRAEVRVNGRGSGWLVSDLLAVATTTASAVRLPKTEAPADVLLVAGLLDELGSCAEVMPILETARGITAAEDIALAHPRVAGLLMGEEDLRADLGCGPEGLGGVRERVVLAARAAGLPAPLQSVWTRLADLDGLRRDCERGKALGFHGRSVIHPSQVPVVHAVYMATDDEVAEARDLVAQTDDAGGGGAVLANGTFVDAASVARARRVLGEVQDTRGE